MSERVGGFVVVLGDNIETETQIFASERRAAEFAYPFVKKHWDEAWGSVPKDAIQAVNEFLENDPPVNVIFVFEERDIIE